MKLKPHWQILFALILATIAGLILQAKLPGEGEAPNFATTPAGTAVILSVDRLLDMSRTVVNIFSDTCAALVVTNSEGEEHSALR